MAESPGCVWDLFSATTFIMTKEWCLAINLNTVEAKNAELGLSRTRGRNLCHSLLLGDP